MALRFLYIIIYCTMGIALNCTYYTKNIYAQEEQNLNQDQNKTQNQNNDTTDNIINAETPLESQALNNQSITEVINKMSRAIYSRDLDTITAFFNYYSEPTTKFIKTSYLYSGNNQKPAASEVLNMNRQEYINYLFSVIKTPEEYSIDINITDIKITNENYAIATIEIKEITMQKITKQIMDVNDKIKFEDKKLKAFINNTCNVTFDYKGVVIINGVNCVESIASNLQ